jgi:hypothetical protein
VKCDYRYAARVRRLVLLALFVVVGATAATARADGDPASDTLIFENVYFPYPAPSAHASAPLADAVRAVYARGFRIKVAVIATPTDLGAIPSLFNKPSDYAKFLGQELGLYYVGPLLIVMPSGFGIYDGGRPTPTEDGVLAKLDVSGSSADALVQSAATAVDKLLAVGALKSKDIKPPYAQPLDSRGKRGRPMRLRYAVFDDSGRSKVLLTVRAGKKAVANFSVPMRAVVGSRQYFVPWRPPASAPHALRLCVQGIDPSRNKSPLACLPLRLG